jgi:hypothetical protein
MIIFISLKVLVTKLKLAPIMSFGCYNHYSDTMTEDDTTVRLRTFIKVASLINNTVSRKMPGTLQRTRAWGETHVALAAAA